MNKRDTFYLRGRLVRILAQHSGTANKDSTFAALCDIAEFNRAHPAIAIPSAAKLMRTTCLTVCANCLGEGSCNIQVGATVPLHGEIIPTFTERICALCLGSGFAGVHGYGDDAVVSGGHEVRRA